MITPQNKSIFITGNSRSGTTMMGRILNNHSDVFTFQELHFFDELIDPEKITSNLSFKESVNLISKLIAVSRNGYFGSRDIKPFRQEAESLIQRMNDITPSTIYKEFLFYESSRNRKNIPCEQTPQNIFAIGDLLNTFSAPRIIIMVRDPRAVLLSQKNKWKRRSLSGGAIPFWESVRSLINYHPLTISKIWNSVMREAAKYEGRSGVTVVRYEDLILSPEKIVRNVCQDIGIDFDMKMIDIPVTGSSNFIDSSNQLGTDKSKIEQWKNGGLNKTEISICENVNAVIMEKYSYPFEIKAGNPLMNLMYQIILPFQLMLSLLFNLKRLKNPKKLFNRIFN